MAKRSAQELVARAERQGWRVKRTKSGWMCFPPDRSKPAVTIHNTPSDGRWYNNALAQLRRSGLDMP